VNVLGSPTEQRLCSRQWCVVRAALAPQLPPRPRASSFSPTAGSGSRRPPAAARRPWKSEV